MGGVLREFDKEKFLSDMHIDDPEDRKLLLDEVFGSKEWAMMDRGSIDQDAAYKEMIFNLPERLHEDARILVYAWEQYSAPIKGMAEFCQELYDQGYDLYLLSNAPKRLRKDFWPSIPKHELFKGLVVSAECGYIKPHDEIFRYLLDTYNLKAEECIFIDDHNVNVEGGIYCGLHGIVFHGDMDRLRERFNRIISQNNQTI